MAMEYSKQQVAAQNFAGLDSVNAAQPRTLNEQVAEVNGRLQSLADDIERVGDRLYGPVPSEVKGMPVAPTAGNVSSILRDIFRALDAAEFGLRRVTNGL